jgi:hypothetical protein
MAFTHALRELSAEHDASRTRTDAIRQDIFA